jgi:hypothetical protein
VDGSGSGCLKAVEERLVTLKWIAQRLRRGTWTRVANRFFQARKWVPSDFMTIDGLFETLRVAERWRARKIVSAYDPEWGYPRWMEIDDTKDFNAEPTPPRWCFI